MLYTDPNKLSLIIYRAFKEKKGFRVSAKFSVLSEAMKLARDKERADKIALELKKKESE